MSSKKSLEPIIAYAHPACPQWHPIKQMLNQTDVHYTYINIYDDLSARNRVKDINNGFESVPTLVFPDGSTLTEPSAGELRAKLESLGYEVPMTAMLIGNVWWLVIAAGILLAIVRALGVF